MLYSECSAGCWVRWRGRVEVEDRRSVAWRVDPGRGAGLKRRSPENRGVRAHASVGWGGYYAGRH